MPDDYDETQDLPRARDYTPLYDDNGNPILNIEDLADDDEEFEPDDDEEFEPDPVPDQQAYNEQMPSNLPPHLQAQISQAGQTIADNSERVENVNPASGSPTDWTAKPGRDKLPEPQHVEPIQPDQPTPDQPKR